MDISSKGLELLMAREGVRTRAYRDSVGVLTIGVGHTSMAGAPKVRLGMVITLDEAMSILRHDVVKYEDVVERHVKVRMTQYEFDALVSLCFNIGEGNFRKSSVVRFMNAGDKRTAANRFLAWNKAGGRVLKGLVTRRNSERAQFLGQM